MRLVGIVEKLLMEGLHVLRLLHFPLSSLNERICSEGLLATKEDDIMKQIQAFFCTKGISACSSPDSQPVTTETAIFVKSHARKRLFSLPSGTLEPRIWRMGSSPAKFVLQTCAISYSSYCFSCQIFCFQRCRNITGRIQERSPWWIYHLM